MALGQNDGVATTPACRLRPYYSRPGNCQTFCTACFVHGTLERRLPTDPQICDYVVTGAPLFA